MIGIITLMAILSGILLFFTNEQQNERVLKSYCGDFGIYGKSLILKKDGTFRFSYHGCSQENGYVSGTWNDEGEILTFAPEHPDENLDSQYQRSDSDLIPLNKSEDGMFTLCEYYVNPWERSERDEKELTHVPAIYF